MAGHRMARNVATSKVGNMPTAANSIWSSLERLAQMGPRDGEGQRDGLGSPSKASLADAGKGGPRSDALGKRGDRKPPVIGRDGPRQRNTGLATAIRAVDERSAKAC